jgi:hypothetical protein
MIDPAIRPAIFLHIPKTAGTSLVNEMRYQYGNHQCSSHDDHCVNQDRFTLKHGFFEDEKLTSRYHKLSFISGHFGFNFCEQFMQGRYSFTFLRDPLERLVSFYYFLKNSSLAAEIAEQIKKYSFEVFLEKVEEKGHRFQTLLWNHQVWMLAYGPCAPKPKLPWDFTENQLLRMAQINAERLSYIGFVETFSEDKRNILQALGITKTFVHSRVNRTENRPAVDSLPDAVKKRLQKFTELDAELYRYLYKHTKSGAKAFFFNTARGAITKMNGIKTRIRNCFPQYTTQTVQEIQSLLQQKRNDYLDLLTKTLCGVLHKDPGRIRNKVTPYDEETRQYGWDWPAHAHTMIGRERLENVRLLMESILGNNIPGDVIETGVWRGGASIMMRAVLRAYDVADRKVYAADSFEGLPPPDPAEYPADAESTFHEFPELAVSLEEVRANFEAYGLLDDNVVFVKGWFKDTLAVLDVEKLALIRLDGDMYESTMDALTGLYDKLSPGGYVIVDDYHMVPACKKAVHDFCASRDFSPKMVEIDGVGVYWQKAAWETPS